MYLLTTFTHFTHAPPSASGKHRCVLCIYEPGFLEFFVLFCLALFLDSTCKWEYHFFFSFFLEKEKNSFIVLPGKGETQQRLRQPETYILPGRMCWEVLQPCFMGGIAAKDRGVYRACLPFIWAGVGGRSLEELLWFWEVIEPCFWNEKCSIKVVNIVHLLEGSVLQKTSKILLCASLEDAPKLHHRFLTPWSLHPLPSQSHGLNLRWWAMVCSCPWELRGGHGGWMSPVCYK